MFCRCDGQLQRNNVEFFYPKVKLQRDPNQIADNLQAAFELLATQFPTPNGIDYRTQFTGATKIKIGFRTGKQHGQPWDQANDVGAGYYAREFRINVPFDLATTPKMDHRWKVDVKFQPEYCCGHELIHPFEEIWLSGNNHRAKWTEGVCDFGRLVLLQRWSNLDTGFKLACDKYRQYISAMTPSDDHERQYHYAAQLILKWYEAHSSDLDLAALGQVFNNDPTKVFGDWEQ